VGCLPLEGAQVVTIARQTGVNGTPRGKTLAAEGGFSANLTHSRCYRLASGLAGGGRGRLERFVQEIAVEVVAVPRSKTANDVAAVANGACGAREGAPPIGPKFGPKHHGIGRTRVVRVTVTSRREPRKNIHKMTTRYCRTQTPSVSKTGGRRFEPCHSCQRNQLVGGLRRSLQPG
jgi:hypothetical protein